MWEEEKGERTDNIFKKEQCLMQNLIEKLSDLPEKAEQKRMRTWPDQKKPSNPEVCREEGGNLKWERMTAKGKS